MKCQMRIRRNDCLVHGEGQFGRSGQKERITNVGIAGLGKADQGVWWFQDTPVLTCRHTFCLQQHALGQAYHPNAWLKLGGIHSIRAVADDGTKFRDEGILFEKQG